LAFTGKANVCFMRRYIFNPESVTSKQKWAFSKPICVPQNLQILGALNFLSPKLEVT